MIALRTLGLIDVRGAGEASRVLAQPKRFALLAYLAITRVPCRRDTLLALLWPELDVYRARLSLRQAVHFLRSLLGPDAITGVGGDMLAVGSSVECDTTEFDRAIDECRLADALAMYAGDLLSGFHVTDASNDFDDWLERERRRLRARATAAAWTLAEAAEHTGNAVESAHRARQAVQMKPR